MPHILNSTFRLQREAFNFSIQPSVDLAAQAREDPDCVYVHSLVYTDAIQEFANQLGMGIEIDDPPSRLHYINTDGSEVPVEAMLIRNGNKLEIKSIHQKLQEDDVILICDVFC